MHAYLKFQDSKRKIVAQMKSSVTTRELLYMHDIAINPNRPINEYAKKNGVTMGTYTTIYKLLVKKGVIEITPGLKDKRIKAIQLTEKGHQIVLANLQQFQKLINRIRDEFGQKSVDNFVNIIERATKIMEEKY